DAMIAGMTLNIFNNHAERVRMANLAQTVTVLQAVILTQEEKMILTPTYHVMEMYKVHQDATLIPIEVTSNDFIMNDQRIPAVSVSASKDQSGKTHISITNIDNKNEQKIDIDLQKSTYKKVSGRILTSANIQDYNSFENPTKITPDSFEKAVIKNGKLEVNMPPNSVVVLELVE
ncbi:MAG TPA: alpha-L-arabinofuranosidase C-terminal domain-containing protein, partial [Flavobacteriaceae bacterium]|nr:alpha-L-arabinofuranosidase C-terminal domain-containing protein [Flavobacteriaceae bacterium]